MGQLTTHVLDTMRGVPAAGMTIELFRLAGGQRTPVSRVVTDNDGRPGEPLMGSAAAGGHELVFHVGAYFAGVAGLGSPPFLDTVPVRFSLADGDGHYHVPLLVSPWSYTTYRGS